MTNYTTKHRVLSSPRPEAGPPPCTHERGACQLRPRDLHHASSVRALWQQSLHTVEM